MTTSLTSSLEEKSILNKIADFFVDRWVFLSTIVLYILINNLLKGVLGRSMPFHSAMIALIYWIFIGYYWKNREIRSLFGSRMFIFVSRRLIAMIPIFLGVAILTFTLMNFIGNPIDLLFLRNKYDNTAAKNAAIIKFGLDKPPVERFFVWIRNFMMGDLGDSFKRGYSVNIIIDELAWETVKLQFVSFFFALIIAIPLGVLAARNHGTEIDSLVSSIALLGLSMPIFVTGITLIMIFGGTGLNWFPAARAHTPDVNLPDDDYMGLITSGTPFLALRNWSIRMWDSIEHMVLPTITLTFAFMATYTRLVRTSMLEVLRQDYITAARANGIPERTVIWKHAFRNCLIPVVTFIGLFVAFSLAGAPITETVFSWPGLGKYYVKAALVDLDYPVIMGITLLLTVLTLFANLITDISYVFLDPRLELD
ncbi:MAG: ABC transporter permease [Candidatus Heimdallarchaeota archaeon]|nr:ABC transporter permease [Candidatus Heimdallarchaeota archaeon]MCK5048361.1 ABC transporter permease [Candidatus Heimdallarchaeota archaeon]